MLVLKHTATWWLEIYIVKSLFLFLKHSCFRGCFIFYSAQIYARQLGVRRGGDWREQQPMGCRGRGHVDEPHHPGQHFLL